MNDLLRTGTEGITNVQQNQISGISRGAINASLRFTKVNKVVILINHPVSLTSTFCTSSGCPISISLIDFGGELLPPTKLILPLDEVLHAAVASNSMILRTMPIDIPIDLLIVP